MDEHLTGTRLVLIILLVVSVASTVLYLHTEGIKNNLEKKLTQLNTKLDDQKSEFDNSINTLTTNLNSLQNSYNALQASHTQLETNVLNLSNQIEALKGIFQSFEQEYLELSEAYDQKSQQYVQLEGELEDLDSKIQEKMVWFTTNSELTQPAENKMSSTLSDVDSYCIQSGDINLPCTTIFLNEDNYLYISEGGEYIKSVEEFAKEKGGDCEDWSIFIRAFLNTHKNGKNLFLAKYSIGTDFFLYEQGNLKWYYPNMASLELNTEGKEYRVICYSLGSQGHCVLALTSSDFISEGDIIFEPQNGYYMGTIVEKNLEEGEFFVDLGSNEYPVWIVILSDDIYVWEEDKQDWIYYEQLSDKIKSMLD